MTDIRLRKLCADRPGREARGAAGRQHVVGARDVVTERHRRVGADEHGARRCAPGGRGRGRPAVTTSRCSAAQASTTSSPWSRSSTSTCADWPARASSTRARCRVAATCIGQLGVDGVEQGGRVGDEQAGRQRVVLGLGDQVGGDERRHRGVVGQDRDLGRAGLGVDAAPALDQALGRRDVDVARAGDHVHRGHALDAVGEHRDRLRATDRVDLVDPEQRARREHQWVRQSAELRLRRRGDRQRRHPRHQGGYGVHDDGRGIGDPAAGDVEPDPADRDPALGDGRARAPRRRRRRPAAGHGRRWCSARPPPPAPSAPPGRGRASASARAVGGHPQVGELHLVEPRGRLAHRRGAAVPDRLDDRPDLLDRLRHVERGPGQLAAEVGVASAAQVDAPQRARHVGPRRCAGRQIEVVRAGAARRRGSAQAGTSGPGRRRPRSSAWTASGPRCSRPR